MPSEASQWTVFGIRCATAAVATAVLVLGGLVQLKVYEPSNFVAIILIGALAAVTLIDNIRAAYRTVKTSRAEHAIARISMAILGATNTIGHSCNLQPGVVGGSVFVAKKRWTWKKAIIFRQRVTVLERPHQWRIRYGDGPQPSRVTWTTSKGAVGEAYTTASCTYKYWIPIAKKHGRNSSLTKVKFDALSDTVKSGFEHTEFLSIAGKYAEVLAVPIMSADGSKVLGVFSVDRPYRDGMTAEKLFDCATVAETVETAAKLVGPDL